MSPQEYVAYGVIVTILVVTAAIVVHKAGRVTGEMEEIRRELRGHTATVRSIVRHQLGGLLAAANKDVTRLATELNQVTEIRVRPAVDPVRAHMSPRRIGTRPSQRQPPPELTTDLVGARDQRQAT